VYISKDQWTAVIGKGKFRPKDEISEEEMNFIVHKIFESGKCY